MVGATERNILVLAGYFKGERFIEQAHRRGVNVYLLTLARLLHCGWPRECLKETFAVPDASTLQDFINAVSYLARTVHFDLIVALDDYDVETGAGLREHLRLPGMGDSVARYFRDKLAMRVRAQASGIPVPPFIQVLNHSALAEFMSRVPAPWMFKPRSEASAAGIVKIERAEELWPLLEQRGDRQSYFLLEKYLPGDVFHVDSILCEGRVIFSEVHQCGRPPFNVAHGGGIFTTHTVERGTEDETGLRAVNAQVLAAFGHTRGVSHTEFIKHSEDGNFYLLETSARVGGAHIAELVEGATGVNLWEAWANVELDGADYRLPELRAEYGGVAMTLARQPHPDLSSYDDPEVIYRAPEEHHAGLVLRASSCSRVKSLLEAYQERFMRDFNAFLPAPEKPTL